MSAWWPSPCGPGAQRPSSRRPARRPRSSRRRARLLDQDAGGNGHRHGHGHCGRAGPKPAPVALLIGALDATTAWRASTGSCEKGGSALSVTADGGETWDKTEAPARSVIRVQPLDEDRVFAVAAGADCELKQYASNDRGDSWQAPSAVSGGWARQLDEPTEVLTPQNDRAQPCGASTDVIDLSRTSADQAQALCADGAVTVTSNGGESWADAGTVKGGLALGNRLESGRLTTYVARVGGDCPGIELVRVAKGKSLDRVSCIGTSVPTKAGQIGLSIVAEAGWLVAGDTVWTAPADLTTWKQPRAVTGRPRGRPRGWPCRGRSCGPCRRRRSTGRRGSCRSR